LLDRGVVVLQQAQTVGGVDAGAGMDRGTRLQVTVAKEDSELLRCNFIVSISSEHNWLCRGCHRGSAGIHRDDASTPPTLV
jgi:hypothetical protein